MQRTSKWGKCFKVGSTYQSTAVPGAAFKDPEMLDRMIDWRIGSIRYLCENYKRTQPTEEKSMQRQFTIELRVDYADSDKNEVMKKTLQQAARHMYANAVLLTDGVKPQVAIFADDFFTGHEEIMLVEDTIAEGLKDIENGETGGVSDELMAALHDASEKGA